jgi:hypothetical protein
LNGAAASHIVLLLLLGRREEASELRQLADLTATAAELQADRAS